MQGDIWRLYHTMIYQKDTVMCQKNIVNNLPERNRNSPDRQNNLRERDKQ